jgi:hypothetical protein
MNLNGVEYVRETAEHGVVRGRMARITLDGVPCVRADLVPQERQITVFELRDALRSLDPESTIDGIREMVGHDGRMHSRDGRKGHVGTLVDLLGDPGVKSWSPSPCDSGVKMVSAVG